MALSGHTQLGGWLDDGGALPAPKRRVYKYWLANIDGQDYYCDLVTCLCGLAVDVVLAPCCECGREWDELSADVWQLVEDCEATL